MALKLPKMAQKLAPAEIYLQYLQLFNTKNAINQKKTIRLFFFLPENPATAGTFFLGTVFHYFHLETAGCEQEAKFGRMAQYCEPWLRERSEISQHLQKISISVTTFTSTV